MAGDRCVTVRSGSWKLHVREPSPGFAAWTKPSRRLGGPSRSRRRHDRRPVRASPPDQCSGVDAGPEPTPASCSTSPPIAPSRSTSPLSTRKWSRGSWLCSRRSTPKAPASCQNPQPRRGVAAPPGRGAAVRSRDRTAPGRNTTVETLRSSTRNSTASSGGRP